MKILLLKALHEENFGHEIQQMFSFFSIDLHKIKIRDPTENFDPYCWWKVSCNKSCHNNILSLNTSQKLLVSEVLKLLKLINSTLYQNLPAIIYDSRTSCLILATYKEKVGKLELVEVANQFCFENEHSFFI